MCVEYFCLINYFIVYLKKKKYSVVGGGRKKIER